VWVEKAEEVSQSAMTLGPNLAEPHVTLGTLYQQTGKFDSAAQEFRSAIQLDRKGADGYRGLAKAEERLGRLDAAEGAFKEAISANPDYWGNYNELGRFYFNYGQPDSALAMFQKVVDLTPDNARGYSNLGAAYQSLGNDAQAIVNYERSVSLKPSARVFSNLATLYRAQGRAKEAAEKYEAALRLDDRDYRIWGNLGGTYMDLPGRKASSDSALDRAIELGEQQRAVNPNDPLLLVSLGQFYAQRERTAEARQLVQRALSLAPEQTDVLYVSIVAYELIRDRQSALATVRKAIEAGLPAETIANDRLLAPLASDPEFKKIVEEAEAAAAAAAKPGA
jgi:serine/threonine-protein kinase